MNDSYVGSAATFSAVTLWMSRLITNPHHLAYLPKVVEIDQ